jgi:very-short-patch-repair endonuclease/predicted transcriptional regulator of viral defense system
MTTRKLQVPAAAVWKLADKQHGVVSRSQLRELGMGPAAIRHRLERGKLHRLMPGIYAVGRPGVPDRGRWMAAVLACGPNALLSHRSAAALLGLRREVARMTEVVVPADVVRRHPGIHVYRRAVALPPREPTTGRGAPRALRPRIVDQIPVTAPAVTLVDLATCLDDGRLEAAINEADHLNYIDPDSLRLAVDGLGRRPGACRLRDLLDTTSLVLTTSKLERLFRPLAAQAGLPLPRTQAQLGRNRVDFYWAELGLIVEADSLRYHRTPFTQVADAKRDNANAREGLTTLRFTYWQVDREPDYVRGELRAVARRLATQRSDS